jgi:hypothetical protein
MAVSHETGNFRIARRNSGKTIFPGVLWESRKHKLASPRAAKGAAPPAVATTAASAGGTTAGKSGGGSSGSAGAKADRPGTPRTAGRPSPLAAPAPAPAAPTPGPSPSGAGGSGAGHASQASDDGSPSAGGPLSPAVSTASTRSSADTCGVKVCVCGGEGGGVCFVAVVGVGEWWVGGVGEWWWSNNPRMCSWMQLAG